MTAPPSEPVGGVPAGMRAGESLGEQAFYLRDGQRDHAGVGRRDLAGRHRRRGLGIGAVLQMGGGDGADRQGRHDQHDVTLDRGIEAGLALVQAEAVLPEPEILLNQPPVMPLNPRSSLALALYPGR